MKIQWRNIAAISILAAISSGAHARQWTNDQGKTIEAEFVSSDGVAVELMINGKTVRYELSKLSVADQEFARSQMPPPPPESADSVWDTPTGWIPDFVISRPAFGDAKEYLNGKTAKAVYEAMASGAFPETWVVNKKDAANEFSYINGRTVVYVPSAYDGSQPMGVYVHVSPGGDGENIPAYAPVMDRLNMIYVSAKGTSNQQPLLRRVKLSVDALSAVKAKYNIDPNRVYVGGLSGGGHMSMVIHAMFPDQFIGSISHAAQSDPPHEGSSGHFPGLTADDLKSNEFRGHKWCVIAGDKDPNHAAILESSKKWEEGKFDYKFFDVPGMGHTNATPEKLEEALKWLGM